MKEEPWMLKKSSSKTSKEKQRKSFENYARGDLNGNPIEYKKEEHCGVLDDDGKKFQILHSCTHIILILIIGEECPFSLYEMVNNSKVLCGQGHTEEQRRCADQNRNYEEIIENFKERKRQRNKAFNERNPQAMIESSAKYRQRIKLEKGTTGRRPTKGDPAVIRANKLKLDICMDQFKVI